MERSAEWLLDGLRAIVKWHGGDATGCNPQLLLDRITALLAAAEARESGERAGVGVPSNCTQVVENTSTGGGVEVAQPTVAEVIAAAEKALNTSECYLRIYEHENKHRDSWDESEDQGILRTDQNELRHALALIARYKEANGETTAR